MWLPLQILLDVRSISTISSLNLYGYEMRLLSNIENNKNQYLQRASTLVQYYGHVEILWACSWALL